MEEATVNVTLSSPIVGEREIAESEIASELGVYHENEISGRLVGSNNWRSEIFNPIITFELGFGLLRPYIWENVNS